jgi:Fe-S-cluster containining protein
MRNFPCTGCGLCCKHVDITINDYAELGIDLLDRKNPLHFPFKWDETGKCENLIDNKCSIYKDRPAVCSVEKTRKILGAPKKLFYKLSIETCNEMMDKYDVPSEFRIKI